LFTPAFSAYFSKRNWEDLGDEGHARSQGRYFTWGLVLLAGLVIGFAARIDWLENVSMLGSLIQVVVWYFKAQRLQIDTVKGRYAEAYARRPLKIPILFASVLLAAFLWWQVDRAFERSEEILRRFGLESPAAAPSEE